MADLLSRLHALEQNIRVGIIGIGNIGKGILYQTTITPGINCLAIAEIDIERAIIWAEKLNLDFQITETSSEVTAAIEMGKLAVCEDGVLLSKCDQIDVLIDSSSSISSGLQYAQTAILHHKHMVMMNSEADLIFGPYLCQLAEIEGVVYTSADGDQHTVIKRLINEIELWGFKTVMAGNMKGFLDRYSNPTKIIPEADKRFLDYKMCTSYTDGTKLCIENALVANAINGHTVTPGMLGPKVNDIYNIFDHFDFSSLWDTDRPIVDYVLGAYPPGGVFVIGFNDHPHQAKSIQCYPSKLGSGPFYLFHRPYHLGHIETMACVAEAFLENSALLKPDYGFVTNVYAYAKVDLKAGKILDGIGGYLTYGLIENCQDNLEEPGLPICLAESVGLKRDIKCDEKIYLNDIAYDPSEARFLYFLKGLLG